MILKINIPDDVTLLQRKVEVYEKYLDDISYITQSFHDSMMMPIKSSYEDVIQIYLDKIEDIVTRYNERRDLEDE